jgi:predicted permease
MNLIAQLFRRRQMQDDLSEEIRLHLAERTTELVEAGLTREDAEAAARREFGDVAQIEEYGREMWGWRRLEELLFDLRYCLRLLWKNLGFTAVVLVTLAIGIGANTAVFSVINAVLLRPLPFPNPDRLMFLSESCRDIPEMYVSMPNLHDWQAMNTVFESLAGARIHGATLTGRGEPERLSLREVTAEFFPTLAVQPIMGRVFASDDDQPHARPVVVLNETFWTRKFARDPRVLDMQLQLDGESYTVIGVVPNQGFHVLWYSDIDAYTSLGRLGTTVGGRGDHYGIYGYARLKPGVTVEAARSEMNRIAGSLAQRFPQTNIGQTAAVEPLLRERVEDVRRPLLLLMGAVGLVLLIACANVANLLTSLATVRRQEIALRSALGAGASRLARQFLYESLLLSLLGGAAGLITAYGITAASAGTLSHLPARLVPRFDEVSVDPAVLLFTLGVSLLTGLAFGIFPALAAYRTDPNEVLKENSRMTTGPPSLRLRNSLVAFELAVSVVLLVAAGLMIKSLFRVLQANPGFRSESVLTARLALPRLKYHTDAQMRAFVRQLTERLAALPGVEAAGLKQPLLGPHEDNFIVEGRPRPARGVEPYTEISVVTPGALEAMGVSLRYGRYFNTGDDENARLVSIIDDIFAERYWPGESAIGKRIAIVELPDAKPEWTTIVGVVRHVENNASGGPTLPGSYFPFAQEPVLGGTLVIRSQQDPEVLAKSVRSVLHSLDPDAALFDVNPLANITRDRVAPRKMSVILLSVLASVALVLAAVGTYGVMAYMVTGRTQEIGLRRALGATPRNVLRLVLSQGMRVTLCGLMVGVVISLALGRIVSPMLFGVKSTDPVTFAGVGIMLLAVAAVACYIPARKATRLNPIEAVRHE